MATPISCSRRESHCEAAMPANCALWLCSRWSRFSRRNLRVSTVSQTRYEKKYYSWLVCEHSSITHTLTSFIALCYSGKFDCHAVVRWIKYFHLYTDQEDCLSIATCAPLLFAPPILRPSLVRLPLLRPPKQRHFWHSASCELETY